MKFGLSLVYHTQGMGPISQSLEKFNSNFLSCKIRIPNPNFLGVHVLESTSADTVSLPTYHYHHCIIFVHTTFLQD